MDVNLVVTTQLDNKTMTNLAYIHRQIFVKVSCMSDGWISVPDRVRSIRSYFGVEVKIKVAKTLIDLGTG